MAAVTWRVITRSGRATQALGRRMGAALEPGDVLALSGDLGAGKTTFIQGLAEGLGVTDVTEVLSPSYTLVNEYAGANLLVHVDFYRLDAADAARALGIDEHILRRDAVVAVEWAERFVELIPPDAVWVRFLEIEGNTRELEVTGIAKP